MDVLEILKAYNCILYAKSKSEELHRFVYHSAERCKLLFAMQRQMDDALQVMSTSLGGCFPRTMYELREEVEASGLPDYVCCLMKECKIHYDYIISGTSEISLDLFLDLMGVISKVKKDVDLYIPCIEVCVELLKIMERDPELGKNSLQKVIKLKSLFLSK